MRSSLIVTSLCLAGACLIILGANRALHDIEENKCDMTYMYEYPKYIKINLKKKLSKQFPRYNLYIYGEGGYAVELGNLKPKGIPVLFIPGNAGSHRQVRSFASVALRKAESKMYHFNYFTVDFDDDLGALFGGVLMEQAKFVHSCLQHILRMYKGNKDTPDSVVLIGHSMGGLIARALYSLEGFQMRMVHLIITLGTPHVAPVLALDTKLTAFYNEVNNFWQSGVVNNITIVSVSGGSRDVLVPVKLSSLHQLPSVSLHHSVVSTTLPHIWLSIDHLALCWCKQLVMVVNRALFDLIDERSGQMINASHIKSQVLNQHFGYPGDLREQTNETLEKHIKKLPAGITSNNINLDVGHYHRLPVSQTILISTRHKRENIHFMALTRGIMSTKILLCTKLENSTCFGMEDLSLKTLPIDHGIVKFLHVSSDRLAQFAHIVVSTSKPELSPILFAQFTTGIEKPFTNIGFWSSTQIFLYTNNLLSTINLPMVRNNFDVFLVRVLKCECVSGKSGIFAGKIHVPWFDEDVYGSFVNQHELEILLKVHTPKPMALITKYPYLYIWNSDQCSLQVKVQYQFGQSMGHMFRVYAVDIPKWMYFWIVIIMTIQLAEISNNGNWIDIWSSIMTKKLLKILPLLFLVAGEAPDRFFKSMLELSTPYLVIDSLRPYDWLLPKFFLIFSAFEIVIFLHVFLKLLRSSFASFLALCSSKTSQHKCEKNFYVKLIPYCLFGSVTLGLSLLSSSLSLYFVTLVLFINNCKKESTFRELVLEKAANSSQIHIGNQLQFNETLLLFLIVVCIQTVPAFISWLKVTHYSWSLASDPFFPLLLILTPTITLVLLGAELKLKSQKCLAWVLLLVWSAGFVMLSLDKLPFFLGSILLVVDVFIFCKHTRHLKMY